jgi:hypothetical protein
MNFLKSSRHCFDYEVALQLYSAIGNCAVIFQRHSMGQLRHMKYLAKVRQFHDHVHVRGHVHVLVLSVSVSVSMPVSISMSVSVSMSILVLLLFKYGAMNIYGRHSDYIVDSQGSYEVARKLKGPLI